MEYAEDNHINDRKINAKAGNLESMRGFPKEWSDDQLMAVRFAKLPDTKSIDPEDWNTKMQFWKRMITSTQYHIATAPQIPSTPRLAFTIGQLHTRFNRKGLTPRPIERVVAHLLASKSVRKMTPSTPESTSTIGSLVSMFGSLMGPSEPSEPKLPRPDEVLFLADVVEKSAAELLSRWTQGAKNRSDQLVYFSDLVKVEAKRGFSKEDIEVMLLHLKENKHLDVIQPEKKQVQGRIVKFGVHGLGTNADQVDVTILNLKGCISRINKSVEALMVRENATIKELKSLIRQKKKEQAKRVLIYKKHLQKKIASKRNISFNLEKYLNEINDGTARQQISKVQQEANQAMARSKIDLEEVEELQGELEDRILEAKDMDERLGEPLSSQDDEDVEAEWQALQAEVAQETTVEDNKQMEPVVKQQDTAVSQQPVRHQQPKVEKKQEEAVVEQRKEKNIAMLS